MATDRKIRRVANCGGCGRFVGPANFNAVYDHWLGGWEWDPMCPACEYEERTDG